DAQANIEFRAGGNGWRYVKRGLSHPEPWGTWSTGPEVELEIPGPFPPGDVVFAIEMRPYLPRPDSKLAVTVVVGGEELQALQFAAPAQDRTVEVRVAERLVPTDGPLTLSLRIAGARSPASLGISADSRALGVGLIRMARVAGA
ncbi:MAG TPA: hypothetical protein VM029_19795, partial [Opitutaceae bacterium]|nr:hypothetical protein [Opitutaceae bacterium]